MKLLNNHPSTIKNSNHNIKVMEPELYSIPYLSPPKPLKNSNQLQILNTYKDMCKYFLD